MSKSLIKIVDNSLLPAAVMILGKFLGVVLTLRVLNIPSLSNEYGNTLSSFTTVLRSEDIPTVTSYSDMVMFTFLAIFFTLTIIRAVYLHSSHIKPTLVVKLADKNLLNLIQSSYEIYHSAAVWLFFSWVATIIVLGNVVTGVTFSWVGIFCIVSSIILTAILFQDVYREIENIKHHPGSYKWQ